MRSLTVMLVALAASGPVAFAPADAAAEGTPSAAGTWSCCGPGGAGEQTFVIEQSGETLSGTGLTPGGEPFAQISGSISGSSVSITTAYDSSSYSATFIGTISGETMSGTWTSNASQEGTWTATRTGGVKSTEEEAAKKAKEEEAKGKRKSAIQVNCDVFDPFLPTEYVQCTAQLGDASGRSPAERPTGPVSFAVDPGGGGGFRGSSTCALAPSQTGGASSFCAVTYVPPSTGLPIGSQPPITATYSGDGTFSSSSAKPTGSPVREALTEADVYEALCAEFYLPGCEGHYPAPPDLTDVCLLLPGQRAAQASAADEIAGGCESDGEETTQNLTLAEDEPSLVADVDCPSSEGPLTDCELELLMKGNAPPALLAKAEYYEKARVYSRQVETIRNDVVDSLERAIYTPIQYAAEPPAFKQEREEKAKAEKAYLSKAINAYFEQLAVPGTAVPDGGPPQLNVSARCPPVMGDVLREQATCEQISRQLNEALKTAFETSVRKKEEAGLTVPFKAARKASASAARRSIKHKARETLLATSGRVTVRAGRVAKVHLKIRSYTRTDLKRLLAHGVHALRSDFVMQISLSTGGTYTRTVPVKIKLVARKPKAGTRHKRRRRRS